MRAAAKELDAMIAAVGRVRGRTHAGVQGDPSSQPREKAEAQVVGMERSALVLDANILIRAVLGQRVRRILEAHADNISFFIPETAYAEAEEHLARLVVKRGGDPAKALVVSEIHGRARDHWSAMDLYGDFEAEARKRLGARDPEDWPIREFSGSVRKCQ